MNQNSTTYANFTFIDGVRQHEYELHATGCRDLKSRPNPRWTVDADKAEDTLAEFLQEAPGAKVFTQACCNPRRMAAAGRILTRTLPVEVVEEAATEPVAEDYPGQLVDGPDTVEPATEPVAEEAEVKPVDKKLRKKAARAAKRAAAAA